MKLTKGDLLVLQNGINQVGTLLGVKFAYCIARNNAILKPEIEALQEAIKPTEKFQEFDAKRLELAKKFSKKDKDNNPLSKGGNFVLDDTTGFEKEFKKLEKEYAVELKKREEQLAEYNKLLKEDTKVELYQMVVEDLPHDITGAQVANIIQIIKEQNA